MRTAKCLSREYTVGWCCCHLEGNTYCCFLEKLLNTTLINHGAAAAWPSELGFLWPVGWEPSWSLARLLLSIVHNVLLSSPLVVPPCSSRQHLPF